jgi:23S rRNA (guanosine2251-2'-O)-methyltransferase
MSEKIYGRKPVLEAIRSGNRSLTSLYLMQGSRDGVLNQIEAHAKAKGIPIHVETRHRMDTMAGTDKHQGVIAVVESYQYADLQDLLEIAKKRNEPPFILLLDEIEDPQNLGAILRSAEASGVHGVVIPKHRAAEVNATVIKASAGAAEHIATVKVTNLNETLQKLKEANVWIVGTDDEAKKNFYDYDYRQPIAVVVGNEGSGLRRLVKENCDELVRIPMAGQMSSLNASVAAALVLFEVTRQRNWGMGFTAKEPPLSSYGVGLSPEKDFFRSGPDSAPQAPGAGLVPRFDISPSDNLDENLPDPPGNNKGGSFRW